MNDAGEIFLARPGLSLQQYRQSAGCKFDYLAPEVVDRRHIAAEPVDRRRSAGSAGRGHVACALLRFYGMGKEQRAVSNGDPPFLGQAGAGQRG